MEQLRKVGAIIANELYGLVTDRNALLIMLAAPLALATIIGMAFGGLSTGEVGFDPIPIAVINQDQGTPESLGMTAGQVALGEQFVQALVPPAEITAEERAENGLWQVIDARTMTDTVAAEALVESGELVAVLIIPPDFSAAVAVRNNDDVRPLAARLITDPGAGDLADIAASIITSIGSQIATGNAAVSTTIRMFFEESATEPEALARLITLLQAEETPFDDPAFQALMGEGNSLPIARETSTGQQATFNPFATFGSSQAIFFMLFTAMATSAEFMRDKRNGILRRLLASPTPISTIVTGKIGAAVITCASQVLVLLTALTLINAALQREVQFLFGTNVAGILAVVAAVSLAAAGVAMAVASLARTPEQASAINGVIAIGMGLLSGAFFNIQAAGGIAVLSRFTINFWAVDALNKLAQGNNAIWLNLGILGAIAAITLTVAFTRFNRTLEA